ncbi:MAG: Cytoplasmic chaperone TorD family protein [uncultured bacterium]|nr:MAG: Cytoplasmic chaperone TorD family protein [uncultured bacterium]
MKIGDFILKEKIRGDCYRLLSACFYQPQKQVFIQEEFFKNLEGLLRPISPDTAEHVSEMEKAFLKYSEEDLLVAYAKLFVGPNELLAPPYGSVYLDGKKMVMGDSTMEVIKLYEEHGLSMDSEFRNLPDHITVELEFMYYLIFKEIEALEKSQWDAALDLIKTQELFFDKFLERWVKQFCDKIRQGTDNAFYTSLADCLSVFIGNARPGEDFPEDLSA